MKNRLARFLGLFTAAQVAAFQRDARTLAAREYSADLALLGAENMRMLDRIAVLEAFVDHIDALGILRGLFGGRPPLEDA